MARRVLMAEVSGGRYGVDRSTRRYVKFQNMYGLSESGLIWAAEG